MDLPRITGRDLQEVARAKKSTAGGLDGWAWNEIKAFPLPWFSGLAILLELVEMSGIWSQGLLVAFFAMIPKVDGDSTTLGQRPLSVLPGVYRLWGLVVISYTSWSLMSSSLLILLIGPFWIVLWVAWGYLTGFVRSVFLFTVRFVSSLSLMLGLVSHGVGMVVFPKAVL